MKMWDEITREGLSYEEVNKNKYFTRPCWDGVHFMKNNDYYILLNSGKILKNPECVFDKSKKDWIEVDLSYSTLVHIAEKLISKDTCCDFCSEIYTGRPNSNMALETIYKNDDEFGISIEQFRGSVSTLEGIKYCPYCGRELKES